ncbi:anion exchange protein 4 [Ophiostoma piceae UAMH 11346]|uniref:Anion exchange protein 4 n=1 Tax=Ophiostoma piceae (strain UAMH 11346) TaxID=1262450 RepID=S3CW67_OPHP1|nr:anion exchange protein 4 [Ophiostoma piceae UAMH 11346]
MAVSSSSPAKSWWKIHLFRGMASDIRRRAPFYLSDWVDAWDYRVVPATIYMYFANILPALAFSLDMFTKTDMHYGVNEVLLSSVLGAVVFSILACQPLVIVGVTGPITVFNYTVYDIISPRGTNYLAFMCWVGLWSLVFHWILAVTNSCNGLRYVTRFPCDIFGFYVAFIYIQKGIQVLSRLGDAEPFYLSIFIGLAVFVVAYFVCGKLSSSDSGGGGLFTHAVRVFLKDYGTPLTVIFFSGFVHIGRMRSVDLEVLSVGIAFEPTAVSGPAGRTDNSWVIHFWEGISVGDVFLAIPFAVLLTILFYFDHNVSSLIAQGTEFPLRKPAGFHWDIFLLGLTTGVAGILGLPFPNGLIPQAPFHTESLCVTELVKSDDADEEGGELKGHPRSNAAHARVTHVVEQRVSNLAQGLLTLGTMTGPLLVVLHLIPQAVLAGLFFVMGVQALEGNGITAKLIFLMRDVSLTPRSDPLKQLRLRAIWAFVAIELIGFGATFAITQTVAAVGFPVFIFMLIPVRAWLLPRFFTAEELGVLDGPTASPFTMESVGGNYGDESSSDDAVAGGGGAAGGILSGEETAVSSDDPSATNRSREDLAELGQSVEEIQMQPQQPASPTRTGIHNRRGQASTAR